MFAEDTAMLNGIIFLAAETVKSAIYPLLKIPLCPDCHRGTNGVHGKNGHELDFRLKQEAQAIFERHYGTRKQFLNIFGRLYK